jgi:hypothetical protein
MRIRTLTAALTAAAMVCTSAPSFAQTAPEPAASVEQGLELRHDGEPHRKRRGTMWAVLGFVVIVIAALLLFSDDGDDAPVSP